MADPTGEVVTKSELARALGFSPAAVSMMISRGRLTAPALRLDGRVNLKLAIEQLKHRADPSATLPGVEDEDDGAPESESFAAVKTQTEKLKQIRLQLDIDRDAGRLVDKAEAERTAFDTGRLIRDRVLGAAAALAGRLAAMTDEREIRQLLRAELVERLAITPETLAEAAGAPVEEAHAAARVGD